MSRNVYWIVEDFESQNDNIVNGTLIDAVRNNSDCTLYEGKYVPFADKQDYGPYVNFVGFHVLYGTINYVSRCKHPLYPGPLGFTDMVNCNYYYSRLPNDWLLNSNYVMVPFYKIKETLQYLGWNDAFIRPNNGRKSFTGFTVNAENVDYELTSSLALTSATPEMLCLIAPAVNIKSEFRFVVGDGRVLDGSEYRWDRKLDIRHDWDHDCWKLAKKVAQHSWQLDIVYVVDVAITDAGPKVVELNSFSCAGLYAMDKKLVVDEINDIVYKLM